MNVKMVEVQILFSEDQEGTLLEFEICVFRKGTELVCQGVATNNILQFREELRVGRLPEPHFEAAMNRSALEEFIAKGEHPKMATSALLACLNFMEKHEGSLAPESGCTCDIRIVCSMGCPSIRGEPCPSREWEV